MPQNNHLKSAQRFFLRYNPLQTLVLWLKFKRSIDKDSWETSLSQVAASHNNDIAKTLQIWQDKDTEKFLFADTTYLVALTIIVGAVLGFSALATAIAYSGEAPVNLFVLLTLFAFLPLVLSITSLFAWRSSSNTTSNLFTLVPNSILALVSRHANLKQLHRLHSSDRLLKSWSVYLLQFFSLAFQCSVILAFFLIATFSDVAFGWSSTIVENNQGVAQLLRVVAWPWQWLEAPPTEQLIEQSRFYRNKTDFDAELLGQWWSYLVWAMSVYGLLPRLVVFAFIYLRFKQMLTNEIETSLDLVRFVNIATAAQQDSQATSANAENKLAAVTHASLPNESTLLAWQSQFKNIETVKQLGLKRWQEDKQWIDGNAKNFKNSLVILVEPHNTPTKDLSDVINLIKQNQPAAKISLALVKLKSSVNNKALAGNIETWQLYAAQHNYNLIHFSETDKNEEPH